MILEMRDVGAEYFPKSGSEGRSPFFFRRHASCRRSSEFGVSEGKKFPIAGIPHAPDDLPSESTFFAQVRVHRHIQNERNCQIAKLIAASDSVQQVLQLKRQLAHQRLLHAIAFFPWRHIIEAFIFDELVGKQF